MTTDHQQPPSLGIAREGIHSTERALHRTPAALLMLVAMVGTIGTVWWSQERAADQRRIERSEEREDRRAQIKADRESRERLEDLVVALTLDQVEAERRIDFMLKTQTELRALLLQALHRQAALAELAEDSRRFHGLDVPPGGIRLPGNGVVGFPHQGGERSFQPTIPSAPISPPTAAPPDMVSPGGRPDTPLWPAR